MITRELPQRMSVAPYRLAVLSAGLLAAAGLVPAGAAAAGVSDACPAWAIAATTPPSPAAPNAKKNAARAATRQAGSASSIAYEPQGIAVGPTKLLVSATVGSRSGASAVIEYGRGTSLSSCGTVQHLAPGAVSNPVKVLLSGLQPNTSYRFRLVVKTQAGPEVGGERPFSTLAGGYVPQGVEIGTVSLGGMSRTDARAALLQPLASPLRLSYAGAYWQESRLKAGATANVESALTAALTATPQAQLPPLKVSVDRSRLNAFVAGLSKRWSRKAQEAGVRLVGKHAVVTAPQSGIAVETKAMTLRLDRVLASGATTVVPLEVTKTESVASSGAPQKAVVVRLGSQTLTAYVNGKPVLEAPVTTGRSALPTPIGSYTVHYRASPYTFISPWSPGSPYYYPPAHVTWAMYFFDNDFLHDDPAEPTSAFGAGSENGPYASHGCVHVPYATMAYLYNWLPDGAPVIVSQT